MHLHVSPLRHAEPAAPLKPRSVGRTKFMDEFIDACYGCGIVQDDEYVREIVGMPSRRSARAAVYQNTSVGKITFCEVCLEEQNFRDLTQKDKDLLAWSFGSMFAELEPERAIALLKPLVEKFQRNAELLSPLGRAFIAVGRVNEGRAWLEEALRSSPNHPEAARDRSVLAAV